MHQISKPLNPYSYDPKDLYEMTDEKFNMAYAEGELKPLEWDPDEGGIFGLIDTYSATWHGYTLAEVFKWYCLGKCVDQYCLECSLKRQHRSMIGLVYTFNWSGIIIDIKVNSLPNFDYEAAEKDPAVKSQIIKEFINIQTDYIRIYFGGGALQFMRFCGLSVDAILRRYVPKNVQVTRCDFAIDFVNINKDFLLDCLDVCMDLHKNFINRVPVVNNSGMVYSIKLGNEVSMYLGSPQSDSLLRVYDKYLQNMKKGLLSNCPYGDQTVVHSWIRLEWQTRSNESMKWLFGMCEDHKDFWQSIMKTMYTRFAFKDTSCDHPTPCDFWVATFDWDTISKLVQNLDFVQLDADPDITFPAHVKRVVIPQAWCFWRRYGLQALLSEIVLFDRTVMNPVGEDEERISERARSRLNEICLGDLSKLSVPLDKWLNVDAIDKSYVPYSDLDVPDEEIEDEFENLCILEGVESANLMPFSFEDWVNKIFGVPLCELDPDQREYCYSLYCMKLQLRDRA